MVIIRYASDSAAGYHLSGTQSDCPEHAGDSVVDED
jgi:hypothetical protein